MHLITFSKASQVSVGILDRTRSEVIDLSIAASDLPGNMLDLISLGPAVHWKEHKPLPITVLGVLHLIT